MSLPLGMQATHTEHEDDPWTINIPDHPARTDSPGFVASKKLAHAILATLGVDSHFYGIEVVQMHHGGSLWLFDNQGWFMVQNEAGIEWSAQFCTDPAKAEALRQNAQRVHAGFPKTIPEMLRLGYTKAKAILETPISTAAGVATWVDSIFNSCVPLPAVRHIGQLPAGGGRHHYPAPITDIDLVKFDDFTLWVTDPVSGSPAAVVPVARRGSGNAQVRVVYATPGTKLQQRHATARAKGKALVLGATNPLAKQAFVDQAHRSRA
jgi:Family of unknown function (DUF6424)